MDTPKYIHGELQHVRLPLQLLHGAGKLLHHGIDETLVSAETWHLGSAAAERKWWEKHRHLSGYPKIDGLFMENPSINGFRGTPFCQAKCSPSSGCMNYTSAVFE